MNNSTNGEDDMSAEIIRFPSTDKSREAAQRIGANLRDSFPLPDRDAELAMLTTICEHLLSSYDDGLCDSFMDRIAKWDAENRAS
jgi:hypothetical protein